MLTEVVLTHPCDTTVHLLDGAWTTPRGRPITHCPGCGEWLGSPFLRVEVTNATPARCIQLTGMTPPPATASATQP